MGKVRKFRAARSAVLNFRTVFGEIHEVFGALNVVSMVSLIKGVLKCLPPRQAELFDPELCYPGFLDWNNFWRESYPRENVNQDLDSIRNIHVYYEKWVKKIWNFKSFLKM